MSPWVLLVSSACVAGACADDDESVAEENRCDKCYADPVAHCVNAEGCIDSSDCPTGTRCSEVDGEARCTVPNQSLKPAETLSAGFEKPRMRLVERPGENGALPVYEWERPEDARVVVCALFACLPEFSKEGPRRIVNYDECVIAEDIYRLDPDHPTSVPFSVAEDTGNRYEVRAEACTARRADTYERRVTALALGCWAYSDTEVKAATRLVHLSPSETSDYGGQIPKDAVCTLDYTQCYSAEGDFFGTCLAGACSHRCVENEDCIPELEFGDGVGGAAGATSAGGASGVERYRCSRQRDRDPVGVCEELSAGGGGSGP